MTCREKLAKEHPDCVHPKYEGGCKECPATYGYLGAPEYCTLNDPDDDDMDSICRKCWDREMTGNQCREAVGLPRLEKLSDGVRLEPSFERDNNGKMRLLEMSLVSDKPKILDSGNRREFETGAVRDIQEGKGRCDLMPLDVVADIYCHKQTPHHVLVDIHDFKQTGNIDYLLLAIREFDFDHYKDLETMFLEVAVHFEEGAKKYGPDNWRKGIPVHCYIDSAVRHYLKFLRGDQDEHHDRAFAWNLMCAIWTCNHKPELNEYAPKCEDLSDEQKVAIEALHNDILFG